MADIAWLQTPDGQSATQRAAALLASLPELSALRALTRDWSTRQARAAVALVEGRRVLGEKLADAGTLYCDRDAAEQTSHRLVSAHVASRFMQQTYVADLGCGMGGDALAIAQTNGRARILAVDRDPARLAMLAANATARGLAHRLETVEADIETWSLPGEVDSVWLDPARRDRNDRTFDPEAWSPPLSRALALARRAEAAGIKLAPGIDLDALPRDAEVEFVSLDRGLRAAVLWLGAFARQARTATILPAAVSLSGDPDRGDAAIAVPGAYLYDLDPAIGRAGLVELLARQIGAWKLDPEIAYLSSDAVIKTPFARILRVLAWLPFSERRLLESLRAHAIGRVDVARRGSPVDTNALERRLNRQLRGSPGAAATVLLTRAAGRHVAIVCQRLAEEP